MLFHLLINLKKRTSFYPNISIKTKKKKFIFSKGIFDLSNAIFSKVFRLQEAGHINAGRKSIFDFNSANGLCFYLIP